MPRERQNGTIGFANPAQAALYECELKGQLSDGHWENAEPADHWQIMCDARAFVATGANEIGVDFVPVLDYDFADPELLDVVADRMIGFVKWYLLFHHLDPSFARHWDTEWVHSVERFQKLMERFTEEVNQPDPALESCGLRSTQYQDTLTRLMAMHEVDHSDALLEIARQVQNYPYTMIDLRRDLNQMNRIMHVYQSGNHTASTAAQEIFQHPARPTMPAPITSPQQEEVLRLSGTFRQPRRRYAVRKTKRPYVQAAGVLLTIGVTQEELIKIIQLNFPEVTLDSIKSFITDIKNPRYTPYRDRMLSIQNGVFKFQG